MLFSDCDVGGRSFGRSASRDASGSEGVRHSSSCSCHDYKVIGDFYVLQKYLLLDL